MKEAMHRYTVDLARHVLAPEYGPEAYFTDHKRTDFPFGKNEKSKTGAEALKKAEAFAQENMENVSRVSIIKWHGYGGLGNVIKDDEYRRFHEPFATA